MISGILGLFVYTLTTSDNYCLRNRENLPHPTQMQLSKKKRKISQFFDALLECKSDFENFEKKKMCLTAYVLTKLNTAKDMVS